MKNSCITRALVTISIGLFAASASGAEPGGGGSYEHGIIEEIIVSAEKRSESIYELPIAISAFSGERLKNSGVNGLLKLPQLAPSMQIGSSGTETFVAIRGVGSEVYNIGAEPGVTISQDDVFFARNMFFTADFMDVERIEVLRGPQGTISGRNAAGGAINIHSRRPTPEFKAGFELTAGNYSLFGAEGYLSGPLLEDRLFGRVALKMSDAEGWLDNTLLDEDNYSVDLGHVRVSLLANITDTFEALLTLESLRDRSRSIGHLASGRARPDMPSLAESFGQPGLNMDRLEFQAERPRDYAKDQHGAILKLSLDLGSSMVLTSVSGYWTLDTDSSYDIDSLPLELLWFDQEDWEDEQFTQELTLTADLTDNLDLILGGVYLEETSEQDGRLEFAAIFPLFGLPYIPGQAVTSSRQELTSYAIYTQLRYQLTEKLRASIGLRYTDDDKEFTSGAAGILASPGGSDRNSWDAWTPRFAVNYQINEDTLVFANVARGFKAGGYNSFDDLFEPEDIWNYEVGIKAKLFDKRMHTAFTAFVSDYEDLQQTLYTPGADGVISAEVRNASKASIQGAEFELEANVTEALSMSFTAAWLDAEFDELVTANELFPELGVRDYSGNQLSRSPTWQFFVSAEYTAPLIADRLIGRFRADYNWRDDQFFDYFENDLVGQSAYGLLSLRVSLESWDGRWRATLFGNNVTDKRYIQNALHIVTGILTPFRSINIGEPRTYGVTFSYEL